RQMLALYDPEQFSLLPQEGTSMRAVAVNVLPHARGFHAGIVGELSSSSYLPGERSLIAVAWELPTKQPGPFRLRFDEQEPIPVPELQLPKDYRGGHTAD